MKGKDNLEKAHSESLNELKNMFEGLVVEPVNEKQEALNQKLIQELQAVKLLCENQIKITQTLKIVILIIAVISLISFLVILMIFRTKISY